MSAPPPAAPAAGPPAPPPVPVTLGGGRPPVTLPTWVNVVLVLILFASCGANRDTTGYPSTDGIANEVVSRLQNGDGSGVAPASGADVQDLCRMLGAVLDGQKKKVDDVIPGAASKCADAARQAANP